MLHLLSKRKTCNTYRNTRVLLSLVLNWNCFWPKYAKNQNISNLAFSNISAYNPSNISLERDWWKFECVTCLNISQQKLGGIRVIFSNFQSDACCGKHFKGNKHDSFHLRWRYARMFILGHNLLIKAPKFSSSYLRGKRLFFFPAQVMSMNKYTSIFTCTCKIEALFYIYLLWCSRSPSGFTRMR